MTFFFFLIVPLLNRVIILFFCQNIIVCFDVPNIFKLLLICKFIIPITILEVHSTLLCVSLIIHLSFHQFSSVTRLCLTPCDPTDCSTSGLPVDHRLPELAQTHVHCVGDAIQPSHPLSSPSPPVFNLSQCQGLFQWVSSSHQVAKVLEFQLQHQSFQWIFRTDFL